jgi:hypothetical protein
MKHIQTTTRQRQMPAPAASNFVVLLQFIVRVNQQIIEALFKL